MKRILFISVLIGVAFILGFLLRGSGPESTPRTESHEHAALEPETQIWTCSMHPQIRLPQPGQCPICGMDLIPASSGTSSDEEGPRALKLSEKAIKLAEIRVAPVERKFVTAEIRMVGKVDYDETRVGHITAWIPGRIDRLYVDYTGVSVRKGDHMVYLYSPELLTAQEELLQALRAAEDLKRSGLSSIRETALENIHAAREKLRLWGLTKKQINQIEKRSKPSDHMTIYSPMSGIVIHKNGIEGMYVKTGTKIYTIADLSHLWVKLDAYESDLVWIRYGQEVEFQTEAYPGEIFKGKISFIDPVLNAKTRTVKVRVNLPNPDGKLKPEMFVRALVRPRVAAGGKVMDPKLARKWICPMHPEIVKDGPGRCDICEMPLVRAESLGYVAPDVKGLKPPLIIPASAPLITGKRAVVYVEVPQKKGVYEGREVVLGPRAGEYYHVREGLKEGELVVVNGNFKIDSAVQILAKPSMMSPEGGAVPSGHARHGGMAMAKDVDKTKEKQEGKSAKKSEEKSEAFKTPYEFKAQLDGVISAYFEIQQALSKDNFKGAQNGAKKVLKALSTVDMGLLKGAVHMAWMEELGVLKKSSEDVAGAKDISGARTGFVVLSDSVYAAVKKFGSSGKQPILRFLCPMAAGGKGAHWLQNKPGTENPYFGSAMFKCGDQIESISSGPIKKTHEDNDHE